MPRPTNAQVRDKERRAVALHLEGKKFEDIAEAVGYESRGAAYTAVMRAIKRDTVADIAEIRDVELARIDALFESLWGIAMEDPQLIEQWVDKKRTHPLLDEDGRQYVYVVPSLAKLEAISRALKLMERRSRYLGLDHADGIAERQLVINQKIGELLAEGIPAILEGLNLTAKQKAAAPKVIEATMLRLATG